jgi:transposase
MPRCPPKDYLDRCRAVELDRDGAMRREIAQALGRPERWVYRALARYDEQVGLASLRDRSSRPHDSPQRTPVEIERAICEMKQHHAAWGRRQICKQLRWQWRDDPQRRAWVTESRVRCVLARHPELAPPAPAVARRPPRQIDYLECNLLWGADIHQTRLPDGSIWETLHWLDLHSRYELGQVTAPRLTEELVVQSFLLVTRQHGLCRLLKTDGDKLFYEPRTGLPTLFERVVAFLGVVHLAIVGRQPWWNGVVERYIKTCRQEVHLSPSGESELLPQAMEAARTFYNQERCHSRCEDQPPATRYQSSPRRLPADFMLEQVPITLQPTVVTRQVQHGGRVALAGRSYPFSGRYAGQTIVVTVDGWQATAQAADGWQRTWDLHDQAATPPASPPPPLAPQPLTRIVNRRGCISLNKQLYYVGLAWIRQTLTLQPQGGSWQVDLPDGSTKTIPDPQLLPPPRCQPAPVRSKVPPMGRPELDAFQARRVTRRGQIAFHHRLYYVGVAHRGETVYAVPAPEGLTVYNAGRAWITTCPWRDDDLPDKPLCPA